MDLDDAAPKSSETDPPAANQPVGHEAEEGSTPDADDHEPSPAQPAPLPGVVPGKPDGEVDTRP